MRAETPRTTIQRVVTLALKVLDRAAYRSRTEAVDTEEVRLALAALWCILKDRRSLLSYYEQAQGPSNHPWESCRAPYWGIAKALRDEGWDAPV
jgi:hypothetical protein